MTREASSESTLRRDEFCSQASRDVHRRSWSTALRQLRRTSSSANGKVCSNGVITLRGRMGSRVARCRLTQMRRKST